MIKLDDDSWNNAQVFCESIEGDWQVAKVRAQLGQADVYYNPNTLEVDRVAFGFQEQMTLEADPASGVGSATMARKGDGYEVTGEAKHVQGGYSQNYTVTFGCPKKKD